VHLKLWIINLYYPSKPVTLTMQNLYDWKSVPLEGWKSCINLHHFVVTGAMSVFSHFKILVLSF